MKTLFNILRTVFLTTGAIIGAGFITGAELVNFFGAENFLIPLIFATIITALVLIVVFCTLKNRLNQKKSIENLMGGKTFYRLSICFSSLVFSASMLAGIDALLNTVFNLASFQVGSILAIILISVFSKFGVKGLEKLNLILMPLIILVVNALIFTKNQSDFSKTIQVSFSGGIKAILYVLMNVFICIPVMQETAKNKSKKALIIASIITAIIIGLEAFIILSAIKKSSESVNLDMPLYFALFKGNFSSVYFLSMITCALTSAFSAYYPLYVYAKEKAGVFGLVVCALITLTVAKLGLSGIVHYAYPIVGGLGALFFIKCLFCIKNKTYADNKAIRLNSGVKYVKKEEKQEQSN